MVKMILTTSAVADLSSLSRAKFQGKMPLTQNIRKHGCVRQITMIPAYPETVCK